MTTIAKNYYNYRKMASYTLSGESYTYEIKIVITASNVITINGLFSKNSIK